jgi:hypothetical protein
MPKLLRRITIPADRMEAAEFHKSKIDENGQSYVPVTVFVESLRTKSHNRIDFRYYGGNIDNARRSWREVTKTVDEQPGEVVLELYKKRNRSTYWIFGDQSEVTSEYDTDRLYSSNDEAKHRRASQWRY